MSFLRLRESVVQAIHETDKGQRAVRLVYPSRLGAGPGPGVELARGFSGWGPVFGVEGQVQESCCCLNMDSASSPGPLLPLPPGQQPALLLLKRLFFLGRETLPPGKKAMNVQDY